MTVPCSLQNFTEAEVSEVWAFLDDCDKIESNQSQSVAAGQTEVDVHAENGIEPTRYLTDPAPPPKLFYRTFWRSLTRRLIGRKSSHVRPRIIETTPSPECGMSESGHAKGIEGCVP